MAYHPHATTARATGNAADFSHLPNFRRPLDGPASIPEGSIGNFAQFTFRDGLTGLFDLMTFRLHVDTVLAHCRRNEQPFVLILMDIDDFKDVNDCFGHSKGDEVLVRAANLIKDSVRGLDICGRCGGDEFGVLLPQTQIDCALAMAERIGTQVLCSFPRGASVTISAGAAAYPVHARSASGLWRKADEALYVAKWRGKNRVTVSAPEVHREFRSRDKLFATPGRIYPSPALSTPMQRTA